MLRLCALALTLAFGCKASAAFQVPALTEPVMDTAGMLNAGTVQQLNQFLRQIVERGGAQIEVLTVKDLGGLSIEEASIQVTDKWKLGKKKEDRGILILLAAAEHKIRIEVGQGLEGEIPDATSNRIVHDVMIPRLRDGSADQALIDGISAVLHYSDPQLLEAAQDGDGLRSHSQTMHKRGYGKAASIIFWIFILLIFLRRRGGGGGDGLLAYGLLGGLGGGGGYGGGGESSWSGGGGGFSGGGASGGW